MRATTNGISSFAGFFAFHFASVSTSLRRAFLPSQLRNTDSSTIRMLTGRREILPMPCSSSAGSECKNPSRPLPASNFFSVLNSSVILYCHSGRREAKSKNLSLFIRDTHHSVNSKRCLDFARHDKRRLELVSHLL